MTFSEYCQTLVKMPMPRSWEAFRGESQAVPADMSFLLHRNSGIVGKTFPSTMNSRGDFPCSKIAGKGGLRQGLEPDGWLSDHTGYNLAAARCLPACRRILRYSIRQRDLRGAISCANKAIVLSDLLVATHIPAMPVWLSGTIWWIPHSRFFAQGVDPLRGSCLSLRQKRWVMLDPSFNSYVTDRMGVPPESSGNLSRLYTKGNRCSSARVFP